MEQSKDEYKPPAEEIEPGKLNNCIHKNVIKVHKSNPEFHDEIDYKAEKEAIKKRLLEDVERCEAEKLLHETTIRIMGTYHNNMELAESFQKLTPIWYDRSKNYWMWDTINNCYIKIDETDILDSIESATKEYVVDKKTSNEILTGIQITGRRLKVKDVPNTWIHTKSGIIDIKTGERINASPEYFLSCPIPHKIGESNDTPIIDKLFKEWYPENTQILYEIIAYCMLDDYPIHRLFILLGSGRNGKSQYLELGLRFIGRYNTVSTDIEKIMESRFEASKLYRKKLALISETNFSALKSTSRIKQLTGNDLVTAEFKGKDPFDFQNYAKMCISSNSLPETLDKTDAMYRRTIVLEFKNKFDAEIPIVDSIPESEYENLLHKCLEILPKLLEKGKFTNEGTVEEKMIKYEALSNVWDTYFNKCLDTSDVNADTPLWIIYEDYLTYCSKNGLRKESKNEIARKLRNSGYVVDRKLLEGKTTFIVQGVKITQITQITQISSDSHICKSVEKSVIPVIPVISNKEQSTLENISIEQFFDKNYSHVNKPGSDQEKIKLMAEVIHKLRNELNLSQELSLKLWKDYAQVRGW